MDQIANRFAANEKVKTSTILSKLVSMWYKGKENIREYIIEMSNLVTRLKALKLELSKDILMHLVLIFLPTQFSPFKISYNTQKEDIDYKETFSPISSKDSFRIIMALVAHSDLELHQMDVKTVFLNGNIDETIYMVQQENFESNDSKQLVCRLKRSIYGLKQASRQWY